MIRRRSTGRSLASWKKELKFDEAVFDESFEDKFYLLRFDGT